MCAAIQRTTRSVSEMSVLAFLCLAVSSFFVRCVIVAPDDSSEHDKITRDPAQVVPARDASAPSPVTASSETVTAMHATATGLGASRLSQADEVRLNSAACPAGMILVEGDYCPDPAQKCLEWLEDPWKFPFARCARYEEPSTCKGERVPLRFCIDKYEAAEESGLPRGDVSWNGASGACREQGKRLCKEHEWVFACEGEEMLPYPYGAVRNPGICNFEATSGLTNNDGLLADHREPVESNPRCVSPFGVVNMVGNIDEWVELDKPYYSTLHGGRRMLSGLKGGWWGPLRNRCRPTTLDHDEHFHELQTGYRCCADAE